MYNYLYSRPLWLVALVIIGGIMLWTLLGYIMQARSSKCCRTWKVVNSALLILMLCVILSITLLRREVNTQSIVDLRPLHTFVAARQQPELYREMVMNVFLFVPFGLSLSQILPHKRTAIQRLFVILALGFIFSTAIEWAQYHFMLGTVETDDVICNTFGTFWGSLPILLTAKNIK